MNYTVSDICVIARAERVDDCDVSVVTPASLPPSRHQKLWGCRTLIIQWSTLSLEFSARIAVALASLPHAERIYNDDDAAIYKSTGSGNNMGLEERYGWSAGRSHLTVSS